MPLLVPVIRITDIRAPFASREAAKRLLGGAVGGEEALDPELVQGDVVGCSEAGEDREEAQLGWARPVSRRLGGRVEISASTARSSWPAFTPANIRGRRPPANYLRGS